MMCDVPNAVQSIFNSLPVSVRRLMMLHGIACTGFRGMPDQLIEVSVARGANARTGGRAMYFFLDTKLTPDKQIEKLQEWYKGSRSNV